MRKYVWTDRRREVRKAWYEKNRERINATTRKRKAELRGLRNERWLDFGRQRRIARARKKRSAHFSRFGLTRKFWSHVQINPDGCWLWTGRRDPNGYGWTHFLAKRMGAHRAIYTSLYGPIPAGLFVMHSCDNPPCCNPKHLSLGTNADNVRDSVSKGRNAHNRGETNPNCKTSESTVRLAVELVKSGLTCAQAGKRTGMHPEMVRSAYRGRAWAHLGIAVTKAVQP